MAKELTFRINRGKILKTELPAFIAGIINVTSDSFCPVGRCSPLNSTMDYDAAAEVAARTAVKLVEEGADILDIGAESTRPGALPVSEKEELNRLIPAIRAIRKVTDCPVSIDTTKAAVMEAALKEGADILNDVSALKNDRNMINVCHDAEIPVILMHNHDIINCTDDTVTVIADQLAERVSFAVKGGISPEKLILDGGVGFGKSFGQNLDVIRNSHAIRERVLERTGLRECDYGNLFPVMMALSRKSCIGMMTGRNVDDRLFGTLSANLIAVQNGASFLRVHDAAATRDMLMTLNALNKE